MPTSHRTFKGFVSLTKPSLISASPQLDKASVISSLSIRVLCNLIPTALAPKHVKRENNCSFRKCTAVFKGLSQT